MSEWIQRILTIGAAFAGADGAEGLRSLLTAQAENFFRFATCHVRVLACLGGTFWSQSISGASTGRKSHYCIGGRDLIFGCAEVLMHRAYHGENLEGFHSMLEKELWQRIPSSPAGKQGNPAAIH